MAGVTADGSTVCFPLVERPEQLPSFSGSSPSGDDEDEAVGHEYWLADGETVRYHGWRGTRDDPDASFGHVRYDNTNRIEATAPDVYTHSHSNSRDIVVSDGTHRGIPQLLLWTFDDSEGSFQRSWKLATHGWSGDDVAIDSESIVVSTSCIQVTLPK